MFEKLSSTGALVFAKAEQAARDMQHEYVGTEDVLLGLVQEEHGIAAKVLKAAGLDEATTKKYIRNLVLPGLDPTSLEKIPRTPRVKKLIEFAIEEARTLKHTYLGTEHLLLGLLREKEGIGIQVLVNHGVDIGALRNEVLRLIGVNYPRENPMVSLPSIAMHCYVSVSDVTREDADRLFGIGAHTKPDVVVAYVENDKEPAAVIVLIDKALRTEDLEDRFSPFFTELYRFCVNNHIAHMIVDRDWHSMRREPLWS